MDGTLNQQTGRRKKTLALLAGTAVLASLIVIASCLFLTSALPMQDFAEHVHMASVM